MELGGYVRQKAAHQKTEENGGELVGIKMQGKTKRTDTSVGGTCSNVLSRWVEPTAQNFCLKHVSFVFRHGRGGMHTEWAPDKLMMGASKLLVRWTDRMRPFLSSPAEEMISWLDGGSPDFARLMRPPVPGAMPMGGDGRLDIFRV